jgi:hypothetical protein
MGDALVSGPRTSRKSLGESMDDPDLKIQTSDGCDAQDAEDHRF